MDALNLFYADTNIWLFIPEKILFFVLSLFGVRYLSEDIHPFVLGIVALIFYLKLCQFIVHIIGGKRR